MLNIWFPNFYDIYTWLKPCVSVYLFSGFGELKAHKQALQATSDFLGDLGDHVIASKEEMNQMAEIVYNNMGSDAQNIWNRVFQVNTLTILIIRTANARTAINP